MIHTDFELDMSLVARWAVTVFILAGAAAFYWLCSPVTQTKSTSKNTSDSETRRGVHLKELTGRTEADTDIDIIALHGLDTRSPETWTWKPQRSFWERLKLSQTHSEKGDINWLTHEHMLPAKLGAARIYTCDWPAELYQPLTLRQKEMEEYAEILLNGIQWKLFKAEDARDDDSRTEHRPIFFVASCLGGILLINALVIAGSKQNQHLRIREATRGIVFLATPFRGTSFQLIQWWAGPLLKAWAAVQGKESSNLLGSVATSIQPLENGVHRFTSLCISPEYPIELRTFYELGRTNLLNKGFFWIPAALRGPGEIVCTHKTQTYYPLLPANFKQLVPKFSATLDIDASPVPLNRPHVMMNKFDGPGCGDYIAVAEVIHSMVQSILTSSPLQKADDALLKYYAEANRLVVTRLSNEDLPIDRCYINLGIVERNQKGVAAQDASQAGGSGSGSSPFPLSSRLKIGTKNAGSLVQLTELFDRREKRDPRRILIRGRAGVGKTTLCKKMVYEFTKNELWRDKFDRILWIPLRNLKLKGRESCSTLKDVLFHEFFKFNNFNAERFAAEIAQALDQGRTLFLLDGWDEVDRLANESSGLGHLLQYMRGQPNVIITSRPSVSFTTSDSFDLELETVGFTEAQVNKYIEKVHEKNVHEIKGFLQDHEIIRSLVRIPIQLDAVCYCWNDFKDNQKPETMTELYMRIQTSLWKKDILRLGMKHSDGEQVLQSDLDSESPDSIEHYIPLELEFLECLAFSGLIEDVIEFEQIHLKRVTQRLMNHGPKLSRSQARTLERTLPTLSNLRSSDPNHNRGYHFIHLTFQEYYAARFFLRHWNRKADLPTFIGERPNEISAAEFLQEHKYNPRYDIMWRFVVGLASAKGIALQLLTQFEKEPLDLLGPFHQRLLMHCLRERPASERHTLDTRRLEQDLSQWMLFEIELRKFTCLAREAEFPENALRIALDKADEKLRSIIRNSIQSRQLPLEIIKMACNITEDNDYLHRDALHFLREQETLPDEIIDLMAGHLSAKNEHAYDIPLILLRQPSLSMARSKLVFEYLSGIGAGVHRDRWADHHYVSTRQQEDSLMRAFNIYKTVPKAFTELFVDWFLFENQQKITCRGLGPKFPQYINDAIAERLTESISPESKVRALRILRIERDLSQMSISLVAKQFGEPDVGVQLAALECLCSQLKLQAGAINAITKQLRDTDLLARKDARQILRSFSKLPNTIVEAVLDRVDDIVELVEALGGSVYLDERSIDAFVKTFQNSDSRKRQVVLKILRWVGNTPERVITIVAEMLKDSDLSSRETALEFLGSQKISSEKVLRSIAKQLEKSEPSVRRAALRALERQSNLSQGLLVQIAEQLNNTEPSVKIAALNVLGHQYGLSGDLVATISEKVNDSDSNVQYEAVHALRHEPNLPFNIINDIKGLLGTDYRSLNDIKGLLGIESRSLNDITELLGIDSRGRRRIVLEILGNQEALVGQTVQLIVECLKDSNTYVRGDAVAALGKQTPLREEILDVIKELLKDEETVRWKAQDVLRYHHGLPQVVVKFVIQQLEDTKQSLRGAISKAIDDDSTLRKETVDIVKLRLKVTDSDVLELALKSLKSQTSLSQNVIEAIAREIRNENPSIKKAAVECLERCTNVPEATVQELSGLLAESEPHMQKAILDTLENKNLTQKGFDAISKLLKSFDGSSRNTAWRILSAESNLSATALGAIIEQLPNDDIKTKWQCHIVLRKQKLLPEVVIRAFATQAVIDTGNNGPQSSITVASPAPEVLQNLCETLVHIAFEQNLIYYVKDNYFWVSDSWGQRKIDVSLDKPMLEAVVRLFKHSRPTHYPVSAV